MVGILLSFWDGLFLGAMLVSGSVSAQTFSGRNISNMHDFSGSIGMFFFSWHGSTVWGVFWYHFFETWNTLDVDVHGLYACQISGWHVCGSLSRCLFRVGGFNLCWVKSFASLFRWLMAPMAPSARGASKSEAKVLGNRAREKVTCLTPGWWCLGERICTWQGQATHSNIIMVCKTRCVSMFSDVIPLSWRQWT